ncbi:PIN domain-like protein, partial [Lentinula novae-zelandiae]
MGIKDLWSLVDDAAFTCKLRDFVLKHGFIKDHYGSRTVVIGVDVSFSKSGTHCIFVYDGDERPSVKRGKQVVLHELDYQKHSRTMIKHFSYYCHTAPGEAEVELVDLYKQGIIDTVLSKDSDVFPLGAKFVMKQKGTWELMEKGFESL